MVGQKENNFIVKCFDLKRKEKWFTNGEIGAFALILICILIPFIATLKRKVNVQELKNQFEALIIQKIKVLKYSEILICIKIFFLGSSHKNEVVNLNFAAHSFLF